MSPLEPTRSASECESTRTALAGRVIQGAAAGSFDAAMERHLASCDACSRYRAMLADGRTLFAGESGYTPALAARTLDAAWDRRAASEASPVAWLTPMAAAGLLTSLVPVVTMTVAFGRWTGSPALGLASALLITSSFVLAATAATFMLMHHHDPAPAPVPSLELGGTS